MILEQRLYFLRGTIADIQAQSACIAHRIDGAKTLSLLILLGFHSCHWLSLRVSVSDWRSGRRPPRIGPQALLRLAGVKVLEVKYFRVGSVLSLRHLRGGSFMSRLQPGRKHSGFPLGRLLLIRSPASGSPFSTRRHNRIRFLRIFLAG